MSAYDPKRTLAASLLAPSECYFELMRCPFPETSELLKVISSSPDELEPVFEAILENATRICQARFGTLNLYDGDVFRRVALHNPTPQFAMRRGEVIRPHPESGFGVVARTKQITKTGAPRGRSL